MIAFSQPNNKEKLLYWLFESCFSSEKTSAVFSISFPARMEKKLTQGDSKKTSFWKPKDCLFLTLSQRGILRTRSFFLQKLCPSFPQFLTKKGCRKNARCETSILFCTFDFPTPPAPSPQGEGRANPRLNKIVSTSRRLHFSVQFRGFVIVRQKCVSSKIAPIFLASGALSAAPLPRFAHFSKPVVRCRRAANQCRFSIPITMAYLSLFKVHSVAVFARQNDF